MLLHRGIAGIALVSGLLLTSCGEPGKISKSGSASPSTTAGTEADFDSGPMCDLFGDTEGSPDGLPDVVPARFAAAADAVVAFFKFTGNAETPSVSDAKMLGDALGTSGVGGDLNALADLAERECGSSEGGDTVRLLGRASVLVGADKNDEYCARLDQSFSSADLNEGAAADAEFADLKALAPADHQDALTLMNQVAVLDDPPTGDQAVDVAGAFVGIGLYAQLSCGIDDAAGNLIFAGLLLGTGGDMTTGSDGSTLPGPDDSAPPTGAEPTPADPSAASTAVPAGVGLTFEAKRVDLEEDGEFLASVVAPVGWKLDTGFDVSFDPPEGSSFGFFTSVSVGAGCDGVCEATDWESRLRGTDGYITQWIGDRTVVADRVPAGSAGAVVTTVDSDGTPRGLVLRWDDSADRYFQCEVQLDADDASLLDALLAGCEASRPGWFPVG